MKNELKSKIVWILINTMELCDSVLLEPELLSSNTEIAKNEYIHGNLTNKILIYAFYLKCII